MSGAALQVVAQLALVKEDLEDLLTLFDLHGVPTTVRHRVFGSNIDHTSPSLLSLVDKLALFNVDSGV